MSRRCATNISLVAIIINITKVNPSLCIKHTKPDIIVLIAHTNPIHTQIRTPKKMLSPPLGSSPMGKNHQIIFFIFGIRMTQFAKEREKKIFLTQ